MFGVFIILREKKKLKLFNLGFNYEEYVDKVMYLLV